ncbi:MAG: tripartite tricarboxylate transporter substrate binding protein [Xanthobacteraceae bacterium]
MLRFMMAALAGALIALPAAAQDYPVKPIRIVIPFGPGGGSDVVGRILGQALQEKFGQPVVIENKPGAAGTIGNEFIARAEKDGYTLGIMTAGQIIAATINKSIRYDTLTAFDPVALVATGSFLIVTRPDFASGSVKDLVTAAKAEPGKIVFASPGFGATQHFAAELFKQTGGVNMLHVPFRTSPEAITALLGSQVDVLFDTVPALLGQVQAGKLKVLAVTGKDRVAVLPDVPTAIESGVLPGYDVTSWYGVFGPSGMPPAVVAKLNKALMEIIAGKGIAEGLTKAGVVVQGSTPEGFGKFLADEYARWDRVREAAGIERK